MAGSHKKVWEPGEALSGRRSITRVAPLGSAVIVALLLKKFQPNLEKRSVRSDTQREAARIMMMMLDVLKSGRCMPMVINIKMNIVVCRT
jgi:hypothetical protein